MEKYLESSMEISGASVEVDGSRWKSIWNPPWKLVEASMEVDESRWKSSWNPPPWK